MTNHPLNTTSEAQLRLLLRGLPRERELESDLWPGIQAEIRQGGSGSHRRTWSVFAMAASLALVAVMALPLLLQNQPTNPNGLERQVVSGEVAAMNTEYLAALKEFPRVELAPEVKTQIQLLDDSADELRQALAQSPQSTYLLPILRRIYLQRLQLTQRAMAAHLT